MNQNKKQVSSLKTQMYIGLPFMAIIGLLMGSIAFLDFKRVWYMLPFGLVVAALAVLLLIKSVKYIKSIEKSDK